MTIYFCASILQKPLYGKYYLKIIRFLEKLGHKVIHSHITQHELSWIEKVSSQENINHYKHVLNWISQADLVIAEASFPSTLNVGHEITLALSRDKTVICLYLQGKQSQFFQGIASDKLIYEEYTPTNLERVLEHCLKLAHDVTNARFNFILPTNLLNYLDWVARKKSLPRAVYLRQLIEKDLAKNKTYDL